MEAARFSETLQETVKYSIISFFGQSLHVLFLDICIKLISPNKFEFLYQKTLRYAPHTQICRLLISALLNKPS